MIDKQGTWADLHVGAYIRDKDGKAWKIVAESEGRYGIVDRDNTRKILNPQRRDHPVTLLVPTEAEALENLKALKARAVARRSSGQGWSCPPFPGRTDEAASHMLLMHGIYAGDVKTMRTMREAHDSSHVDPAGGYVAHTHPSA